MINGKREVHINMEIWFEEIKNSISNFSINCYRNCDNGKEHILSTHMHNHFHAELLCVEVGAMQFDFFDGDSILLETGDIIFVNSMIPHETHVKAEGTTICVLQFDISDYIRAAMPDMEKYSSLGFITDEGNVVVIKADDGEKIRNYMKDIVKENSESATGFEMMTLSGMYGIIGELIRREIIGASTQPIAKSNMADIRRIFEYVEKNYSSAIALEEIASYAGISVTHFCRIFKAFTGKSFVTYLNIFRLYEAEKRLTRTDESITDIALSVGFTSSGYFDRLFKRCYKISPSKYRELMRAKS